MSLSLKTQARIKKQLGWTDDDFKKETPSKAESAQPSTNNIDLSGMTGASRRTRDDAGVRGAYAKREDALTGGGLGDAVRSINTLAVKGIQNNNEADRYNSALVELQKILETGGPVGGMTFREDGTVGQNPSPIKQGSNAVTDVLGLVGRNTMAGVDQLNSFLMKSADFFLPDVITPKPVQNVMDWYKTQADRSEQEMLMENYARGGELGAVAGSVYQGLIPSGAQMIFTLMSGGVNNAGTVLNALKNAGVSQGITSAIGSAMKNPSFWTSFAMTAGSDYEDAKANGASETAAITTAFLSSMLNAGIEIGGGVDDLAKNAGRIGWRDVAKSALGEGLEEVEQGVTTGVVHKGLYDKDREWFSKDNPEAVVNPSRMVSEFAGGSIAGGIFSGGHALINNALNYRPEPAFTPEQRTLLDDIERRLTGNNPAETMSENEENIADRSAQRTAPANVPAAQAISPAAPETPAVAQKSGQAVDSQVLAADMAVMQSLDGVFGKNGASFIRQMYSGRNGSVSAADLYQEYLPLYEAGVNGRDMSAVRTRPNGILDETEREVAYQAGVLDAQVSLAQEKQAVGNQTIAQTGKVTVEKGVKMDRRTVRTLENVAKALGVQIEVKKTLGGRTEGYISGGKIYVSASAPNPVLVVAAHEITHRMQDMAPTEYRAYRDYVMNTLATARGGTVSALVQEKINDYARAKGQTLNAEQAMDELAASHTREMMQQVDLFERFAKQNSKEANWLVKAIREFIAKVKRVFGNDRNALNAASQAEFGADYDVLVQAEKLWSEALKAAETQAKDAKKTSSKTEPKQNNRRRNSFSSLAFTFFEDENMTAEEFAQRDYRDTDGYREYVEQCLNNLRQSRPELSEKAARAEVEHAIDGIVRVAVAAKRAGYDIQDNAAQRSTRDSKNRLLFSSLEPNSEYFTSNDLSTICDKRKNFADIYDDIVRAEEAKGVPRGKRFFDNVDNYFYLHKLMADKGLTQPCRQCYVESMRKNLAPMANAFLRLVQETDPNNMRNDQLFHQSGKDKGKPKTSNTELRERVLETLGEYDMTVADLNVETLTTEDGLAQLKITAPLIYEAFNSFYGQSKPKMPKTATPFRFGELTALLTDERGRIKKGTVERIAATGGFRLQSYSDFQIQNFVDVLQVLFEAGTLGLKGHAYTKVPAFLDATADTNLKRNISIFMYKDGNEWKLDKNDSFPYDLEEIYDIVRADKKGNTGIIAVSQNEDMSAWIMANDMVGYGIPFHKSGLKMGTVRDTIVREGGREIRGYTGTKDHTRQQTEVWAKAGEGHKALTKVKKPIDIYSFWDFENKRGLSKNKLIEKNVKAYINACIENGYLPKFREYVIGNEKVLNNVLAYAKKLGYAAPDATVNDISFHYKGFRIPYGYYKFLGDFGMFTPDGKAAPHEVLSLKNYDFDRAVDFFKDAEGLRRNEILQQFANGDERQRYRESGMTAGELQDVVKQKRREVADDVVNRRFSITDSDGNQLTKEQQEFFKDSKVRDDNGRLLKVYHGSKNSGFNVFRHSPDVQTGTDYGEAFYFTSDRQKASGYSYDVEKDERVAQYQKGKAALRDKFLQTRSEEDKNAFLNYKLDGKNLYDMIDDESYLTEGGEVKEVYLNLTNPLIVDAGGKYYYEVYPESFEQARKNGNDGIVFKNVIDNPRGKARPIDTYVAFHPEQIKNVSNVKPTDDPDIRYSVSDSDSLHTATQQAREIARLRQQVEKWKQQTGRNKKNIPGERGVRKAARTFSRKYGAQLNAEDLILDLNNLYDYMYEGGETLEYNEARKMAEGIAQRIAESAIEESDDAEAYREMKDYLRGLRISVPDADKASIENYESIRRSFFGRVQITKDGTPIEAVYEELSQRYPSFFDAETEVRTVERLDRISAVYNEINSNIFHNPFSEYMDSAVADIANDIMATFFEDNAIAQQDKRHAKEMQRAMDRADARLERYREKMENRVKNTLSKERDRREKQATKLRERFLERNAAGRVRQEERELRRKIERHVSKLNTKLLRPTDKQNVPENLRTAMAAALDAINLSSKNHKMTGRTQAFIKLRREYAAILNGKEDFDLALDPDLFGRGAAQGLFDRVLDMGDTPIAELKKADLDVIWKVVRSLEHAVNTAGKTLAQKKFASTIEWARAIERDTSTFKSKKTTAVSHRVLDHETPYTYFNHFGAAGHEIYRMLRNAQDEQQMKLDSIRDTVSKIADEKAVRKLQKDTHTFDVNGEKLTLTTAHVMELYLLNKRGQARDHLMGGGIMQPEIKSAKIESSSQAVLLDPIQLGKILSVLTDEQKQMADKLQKLTTTTLAEWGNDASMKAYGYKKFTGTDYWPIRCAKEEIHTEVENGERNVRSIKNIGMAKAITPGANNALQLRGVFQTFAAHAGDMIDYSTWLCPMEDANRLLNFRFKDEHGVQTGTMKNLIKQYSGDDGYKYWTGLMDDIQNGIGRQADAAIVKDLAKATSYVKASSVGANIRVIVQQPTAIVRAAVVLDPQHLLGGVVKGKTGWRGWQKAVKYAPIAARKAQGGYEIKNMQSMSEVLYNEKTALGKFNDLTTAGAAKADEITWGRIWNACERQIKAQDNSIDVRTSEFNEKVAELFTEVIDQTQVVDGVLQRSRAMRSSDTLVKMATSFMGEPTQSLNILLRAWDGVRREGDGKNRSKAMKTASRAAFAVLVTDIVNAFAQSLVDSTRDDDEEKKYWERVWAAFTGISGDEKSLIDFAKSIGLKGNLVNNLNPINRIYGLKDTMSILQGFTVERMDTSGLADFIKAAADGLAYIGGNGEKTRLYAIRQLLTAGSKLFGIPAANIFRDVISIARSVAIENGDNKALFEMRKMDWRIEDEDNKNKFLGLALKAKQEGDDDVAEEIFDALKDAKIMTELEIRQYEANQFDKNANDLIEAAFEAKKSGDDVALNVLTDMLIGMGYTADKIEDALDKKTLSELRDSWEYAETKSDAYVKIYDEATASAAYSQLTSEQKESFASRVNTYSRAVADDAHIEDYEEDSKWILRCQSAKKEVGMTESQFLVAYHATSGLESLKDKDGETIKNSPGLLKMQAIYNIPGLNEKQRHYMYDACSVGKSIRAYSKAKVNEELAKMRKHAK